jgi:NRAMP (natural resistance-associated macrophage protein)-like metal ion transporter
MPAQAPTPSTRAQRRSVLSQHRDHPRPLRQGLRWLSILGPGVITGAADDDPSGIATYSQAGAAFGTGQLWLALYMLPLLIAVQEMCGRIGLVTGQGIAACVRKHYSRPILYGTVVLVFVANTINVGADLGAIIAAVRLLAPGLPFVPFLLVASLGILMLEIFVPYRRYVVVLKILTLSLLAYVVTGLIIGLHGGALLKASILPTIHFSPAFLALVVGVLGTTISPYLFFWQASEEVEELKKVNDDPDRVPARRASATIEQQIRRLRIDTFIGMTASEITTWFIIFTTGSVLFAHGVTTITSAGQAASALEPLVQSFPHAGEIARAIFALGIIGTGLLAVPVLAGSAAYAISEAFRWHEGLAQTIDHARGFYLVIVLATLIGVALNLLGVNPISALVLTAIINGVVAVPLLVLIMLIANNSAIMGGHTNGRLSNIVGWITTVGMGIAAVVTVIALF